MAKDYIGYEVLADQALRTVVREALKRVQKQGLLGSHHFYLTFKTHDPGVEIPEFLQERYPDEMTIVLQNQFWGLKVEEDKFEVTLTFQKLPATLVVPYEAMTAFADPAVPFGLQFRNASTANSQAGKDTPPKVEKPAAVAPLSVAAGNGHAPEELAEAEPRGPQIVSLDKFRKK